MPDEPLNAVKSSEPHEPRPIDRGGKRLERGRIGTPEAGSAAFDSKRNSEEGTTCAVCSLRLRRFRTYLVEMANSCRDVMLGA
jgi:hypothetical protein